MRKGETEYSFVVSFTTRQTWTGRGKTIKAAKAEVLKYARDHFGVYDPKGKVTVTLKKTK